MFFESVAGRGGAFTEEGTQTPALVRQHFSVARATRIGSGTQSGSRTRIRRIATEHSNLLKNRDVEFWCSICLDDDHALVVMNLQLF